MLKSIGSPVHVTLFTVTDAVTETCAVSGELLFEFVALNAGMAPLPLAPKPIEVFELVQAKVVPETGLVKEIAEDDCPVHKVMLDCALTVGFGMTSILND